MPLTISSYQQYKEKASLVDGPDFSFEEEQVRIILESVRMEGDQALFRYSRELDGAELENLAVSEAEISAAVQNTAPEQIAAIRSAKENIERFHRHQVEEDWWEEGPGWRTGQRIIPLDSVGAYIPGGRAAYPSSVLMTTVPARIAGVREVIICTPPDRSGSVNNLTLAAAHEVGVTSIYKLGGAQAIAAMAFGTATIPAVQKIVGPGNIYVTLAKKALFGRVGIDMLAGPSEVVIVADRLADPAFIAADMLSQAEHDPHSRAVLITACEELAVAVIEHLGDQLINLPRREIAGQSLRERGAVILVAHLDEVWPIVNELAPEHLQLNLEDGWAHLERITGAAAVFIGSSSPIALGDYWAGSNHVLPTGTAARYASALGVADFMKRVSVVSYSAEALQDAAAPIVTLARAEGLEAHARAVLVRRKINDTQDKG